MTTQTRYIPATSGWFTAPCPIPGCNLLIRAAKRENLPRVVARHVTMFHPGETETKPAAVLPDPALPATHKRIAILAVHYSGSRKRLAGQFKDLTSAIVPVGFPGESGVAVVSDGVIRIYERLGAGVRGWPVE